MTKMKPFAVLMFSCLLGSVRGQDTLKGIKFTHGLTWQAILAKAKLENKYVFVDMYATWCGPCKEMDNQVYPSKEVGSVINADFLSVRVQADRTAKDGEETRGWYADADSICKFFHVNTFPTFLFFGSDGGLISKEEGFKSKPDFI